MESEFILNQYFGTSATLGLREQLYQPIFLKTHLDIVYTDITNWERSKLLNINFGVGDINGEYKKTSICFMDYLWIKIVDQLRRYGFSYRDILLVKKKMSHQLSFESLYNDLSEHKKQYENTYEQHQIAKIKQMAKSGSLESKSFITFLELLAVQTISKKWELKLLFFKEYPEEVFPFTKEILETIDARGASEAAKFYFQLDHFSFSFYKLFTPFITKGLNDFDISNIAFLSDKEHKLITIIRREFKNLKSVNIRFNNNEITHIEITKNLKKVALESRIMDHIKKGDYADIQIITENGRIVNFENTKKIKL